MQSSYYRARYYDSAGGRFLSEDPLRFGPGLNFYSYVNNSPVSLFDPTGMSPLDKLFGRQLSDCVKNILKDYFPTLNLDQIRMHLDRSVDPVFGASAMTHGNQIYYDPNSFDTTSEGLSLLGHELTHSVQYGRTGLAVFYYDYVGNYLANRFSGMNSQRAYEQIPAEVEANKTQRKIFDDLTAKFGALKPICKDLCQ